MHEYEFPVIPSLMFISMWMIIGIYLSNFAFDSGIRHWISRKIAHLFGAMGYVVAIMVFDSWVWPFILSITFTCAILALRLFYPLVIRGIGGNIRSSLSEVAYPLSGSLVIAFGWGAMNQPLVSLACICMMGIGDAVTGIIRSRFCDHQQKHLSGSIGMFLCCWVISLMFIPGILAGFTTAMAATLAELIFGDSGKIKFLDDNLMIPTVSLSVALIMIA